MPLALPKPRIGCYTRKIVVATTKRLTMGVELRWSCRGYRMTTRNLTHNTTCNMTRSMLVKDIPLLDTVWRRTRIQRTGHMRVKSD